MEFQGKKRKNTGKFQGMVKVLNGIPGEEKKKHWKIPGDGESFEWNSRGRKEKNTGKFQRMVKVLMEFQGKKRKHWKVPGQGESFDGIPGEEKKTLESSRGW